MDFHPKDLPVSKIFDLKDEKDAIDAVNEMVLIGFEKNSGFKVLLPKEKKLAKRMGYTITTGVTSELRSKNKIRDIRYWTYHHDQDHYAIVLISNKTLEKLGY